MLTLKQASEQTGKTKQAIQQAIKKGRISATKNDNNNWIIDPVELFRVYDTINKVDDKKLNQIDGALQGSFTGDLHLKVKELEIENRSKDEKIDFYKEQFTKVEKDRDDWKDQAKKLLLTAPITPQATVKEPMSKKMMTFLFCMVTLISVILTYMCKIYWIPL